jgi:hypothetical protein
MIEKWKPIPGFRGYDASNKGNIRSYRTTGRNSYIASTPQRILKPGQQTVGYETVCLRDSLGQPCSKLVHRLVLLAFVGPCPEGLQSCHNDGDRANNRLSNLRYDSGSGNQRDIPRRIREERSRDRIPDSTVIAIRQDRAAGISVSAIAEKYQLAKGRIYDLCTRKTYRYLPGSRTKGRVSKSNMTPYSD